MMPPSTAPGASPSKSSLSKYDAFPSLPSSFEVRTSTGGLLSLVTLFLLTFLCYNEAVVNFTSTVHTSTYANSTLEDSIEVEFDVTFPLISCDLLYVDASDSSNQPQSLHLSRQHHVYKRRLNALGRPIGGRKKHKLGGTITDEGGVAEHVGYVPGEATTADTGGEEEGEEEEDAECGSCYGAGADGECCDTCEDVRRAYRTKGWTFRPDDESIVQCVKQREQAKANHDGEGCNVYGNVQLLSSGGNLHVAPGKSLSELSSPSNQYSDEAFADLLALTYHSYNVTHTVNKLRFGNAYPGNVNQLDGEKRVVRDGYAMYQYYIQVVPTTYQFLKNSRSVTSAQFSVTEHQRHVNPGSGRGLPGLYFYYEVSPLHVKYEEVRKGWLALLTSVASVCGGVFVSMRVLDGLLFESGSGRTSLGR